MKDLIEGLPPTDPATQEIIEEALHITGLSYFAQTDVLGDVAGKTSKVVWTREPSEAFVSQDLMVWYLWGVPYMVERGGLNIDVKRNIVNPTSTTGNTQDELSWMLASGSTGSAAEHAIFEQLYGVESVSTEKILALANRWNIPIYTIDETNINYVLPQLDTFDIVKQSIRGHKYGLDSYCSFEKYPTQSMVQSRLDHHVSRDRECWLPYCRKSNKWQ